MSGAPVKPRVLAALLPGRGYSSAEIAESLGIRRFLVYQALHRMSAEQLVYALQVGRDHLYFRTAADRNAFSDADAQAFWRSQSRMRAASLKLANAARARTRYAVAPARPALPPAVTVRLRATLDKDAQADYSRARLTVGPSFLGDARYMVSNPPRQQWDTAAPTGRWSDYAITTEHPA